WWQRDRETSRGRYEEALAIERGLDNAGRIAEAIYNLSFVIAGEDIAAAARMLEEALELYRKAGDERGGAAALAMLVIQDAQAGRWTQVADSLEEVVAIYRRLGDRLQLAFDLLWLGFAYGHLARAQEARSAALEALRLFRAVDNVTGIGIAFSDLAFLSLWEGRYEDAILLEAAAEHVKQRVGGPPGGF